MESQLGSLLDNCLENRSKSRVFIPEILHNTSPRLRIFSFLEATFPAFSAIVCLVL